MDTSTQTNIPDDCDSMDAYTQTDILDDCDSMDASTQTDIPDDCDSMDAYTQTDIRDDCDSMDTSTQTEQQFQVTPVATLSMQKEEHLMSPVAQSRIVHIPLNIFFCQRIHSLRQLHSRLVSLRIIENWFLVATQPGSKIQLCRVDGQDVFTLEITDELKWFLHIASTCLPSVSNIFQQLPSFVTSLQDIKSIVTYINTCSVCKGNGDPKFTPLVAKCKGVLKDRSGEFLCSWCGTCMYAYLHTYIYISTYVHT